MPYPPIGAILHEPENLHDGYQTVPRKDRSNKVKGITDRVDTIFT
jgi:hypothetical protein